MVDGAFRSSRQGRSAIATDFRGGTYASPEWGVPEDGQNSLRSRNAFFLEVLRNAVILTTPARIS